MRFTRFIPLIAGITLFILGILYFAIPVELSFPEFAIPKSLKHQQPFVDDTFRLGDTVQPHEEVTPGEWPSSHSSPVWNERANKVKGAFMHAYRGYMQHAAGWDELLPVSKGKVNK